MGISGTLLQVLTLRETLRKVAAIRSFLLSEQLWLWDGREYIFLQCQKRNLLETVMILSLKSDGLCSKDLWRIAENMTILPIPRSSECLLENVVILKKCWMSSENWHPCRFLRSTDSTSTLTRTKTQTQWLILKRTLSTSSCSLKGRSQC